MRKILRTLFFCGVSLYTADYLLNNLHFGSEATFWLIVIGLSLLFFFSTPILKLLSLPHKGISGIFLSTALIFIVMYLLTLLIPNFSITEANPTNLRFLSFMLPFTHLTQFWSAVASALVISIINHLLFWMCKGK